MSVTSLLWQSGGHATPSLCVMRKASKQPCKVDICPLQLWAQKTGIELIPKKNKVQRFA